MDNNIPDFNVNKTVQDDVSNLDKLTQSYLSLKKRISGTHEVIKQYNDKLKECERLKQDLDVANKQIKTVTCNYNSTLAKVIKLELQSTEYKKNIETLTTQVNDYQIKIAADQQHIQQLICKIKDIEGNQNDKIMQYDLEKSSLQVKVKELEQELKNVKKSYEIKMKKLEKRLPVENENKPKMRSTATNTTTLCKDVIVKKPKVAEKCTLTDEFFKIKDDLYTIFCAKCEVALEPPPLEKICKIMANSCPKLIEKISSPSKKSSYPLQVSTDVNNEQCKTECLPTLSDTPPLLIQNENNHANFMPTNLLPPHTISLNRTDYCNTFPPESNLMNPSNYYIRSAPINSLELANTSAANQNNHCESIATTMASSLSIISSMQKRIDMLKTKIKKKLNKRKSDENNSCCQHHRPNVCYSSVDTFNHTGVNKMDVNLECKNPPHVEMFVSSSNLKNTSMNETAVVELVKGSIECGKSVGGETDSGILSDSIESGKLVQLEADMDAYSDLTEHKNMTQMESSMRKLQELKKSSNRQKLLKKLKNLRKNSKVVNICQKVPNCEDMQNYDHEIINNSQEQKIDNPETITEDHYIPNKKPRIAHIPKSSMIEEKKSWNNSLKKCNKRIVKSTENTNVQKDSVNLSKPKESIIELETAYSNRIEEPKAMFLDTVYSAIEDVEESVDEILSISEIKESLNELENKSLLDMDINNYDHSYSKSNINHSLEEATELNETKTELNIEHKTIEQEHEINFLAVKKIDETDNRIQEELNPEDSKHSIDTPETNDISDTVLKTEDLTMNACIKEEICNKEDRLISHCLLMRLQQYVKKNECPNRNCKSQHKQLSHARLVADKFVKKQLQRLINSEWEASTHWNVIEQLKSTCTARIIAKGIVEFLSTEEEYNRNLDKSHTPPAPLMTKAQQRIAALLVDLEGSKPTVFQLVQAGIEYRLFRLNQTIEKHIIDSLARMYTVLARISKDREKVRIFCCDALYCLGLNAIIILYTVFTCWPEVFPSNETGNKLLPKCMAHLIMAQQATTEFPKLFALKNLVSVFYKYQTGTLSADVLKELLTALQICPIEKSYSEIETAVILLAKREGTTWTYKNIIRGALLPMIINNKLPSTYRAFYLLGNLMRAFPVQDKNNSVGEIVEQLCDLINSGEGSDEQKEGVISALLSLSRHKFDETTTRETEEDNRRRGEWLPKIAGKRNERAEKSGRGPARPEVTVKCVQLENNLNSRRFAIRVENDLAGNELAEAFNRSVHEGNDQLSRADHVGCTLSHRPHCNYTVTYLRQRISTHRKEDPLKHRQSLLYEISPLGSTRNTRNDSKCKAKETREGMNERYVNERCDWKMVDASPPPIEAATAAGRSG
ncbi:hypothetical protein WH47_03724 [Habropoda laboriosa]|uniref:Uncharacterized protein n=1 Tax=Habropoda laboriosa TaxID=597456 RepID=A0A0L7QVW3_9HYME|nr:hypothetical protein WH47_03724 [Habropoda laboriosa]